MILAAKYNFIKSRNIFWVLTSAAVFLLAVYVSLIGLTVRDVVIYDKIQGKLAGFSSELIALEEKYLELSGTVSLNQARALGFVNARKTYFLRSTGELLTTRINAPRRQ